MRDRNGAELKPGDECEFTCRVKVSATQHALGVLVHRSDSEYATAFLATPSKLTKVQPEFEWKEDSDFNGNQAWRLFQGPVCVRRLFQVVRNNAIAWRRDDRTHTDDYWPTLEAAKAAALAACRSAAEGGKEQS